MTLCNVVTLLGAFVCYCIAYQIDIMDMRVYFETKEENCRACRTVGIGTSRLDNEGSDWDGVDMWNVKMRLTIASIVCR